MTIRAPLMIESSNVSFAWAKAMLHAYDQTRDTIRPLLISVGGYTGESPYEHVGIRTKVDETLENNEKNLIRITSLTIFPHAIWCRRGRPSYSEFNSLCTERLAPRLKKLDSRNAKGIYFERMMNFVGERHGKAKAIDQLGFIIGLLNKRAKRWPRQSALQICCFDPSKDHTGQAVRGFPCLQQVSVTHDYHSRFAIQAYYPTQYIFDRAYGNYLGLCHLGEYIAASTGLKFVRLNCLVARPERGDVTKGKLRKLMDYLNTVELDPAGENHE